MKKISLYQRPYIRRQSTLIHYLCDAYLGTPYPSYQVELHQPPPDGNDC